MRFWGRARTTSLYWRADPWPRSDFSAASALIDTHAAPGSETAAGVAGVGGLHQITTRPFDRILRDNVPRSWAVALAMMLFVYLFTCGAPRLFDQIDGQYAGA